ALELLATPKPAEEPKPKKLCDVPFREWPDEERREWIHETSWGYDQFWEQSIVLDCMGWELDRIAAHLFVSRRRIELALYPQPPIRFDSEANGRSLFPGNVER